MIREAKEIQEKEEKEASKAGVEYTDFHIRLKLIRSDIRASNMNGQSSKASAIWIHDGSNSVVIAEKLMKKLEEQQDEKVEGRNRRILGRNIRVMQPTNKIDTGLYELVVSLKQNQLSMSTTAVNYIRRVDQYVHLQEGQCTLREVILL